VPGISETVGHRDVDARVAARPLIEKSATVHTMLAEHGANGSRTSSINAA